MAEKYEQFSLLLGNTPDRNTTKRTEDAATGNFNNLIAFSS